MRRGTPDRGRRIRKRWGVSLLVAALFIALLLLSQRPDATGFVPLAIMLALLVAGLWWQAAEQVRALHGRTRLLIAGILGDGRPRSVDEITRELRTLLPALRIPVLRWLNLPERALAEMTRQGILALTADKYTATPTKLAGR